MERKTLPEELKAFLADCGFPWAVCGGFALELFLGKTIRAHGDIDICVFEKDRDAILRFLLDRGWRVYEFRGQGKVRPLMKGMQSDPGRNLMCLTEGCDFVKFYPCEDTGLLYHQFFHKGMKKLCYLDCLFSAVRGDNLVLDPKKGVEREMSKAILSRNGIPYLAPEIALLYKAGNSDNPDYQLDFEETFPHLNEDQRERFLQGMRRLYPEGHPWIR